MRQEMKPSPLIHLLAGVVIVAWNLLGGVCRAEVTREEVDDAFTIVRMTVDPAAAPQPAFKYRLLPASEDRVPGNAVPFYHRALADMQHVHEPLYKEFGDEYQSWFHVPLEQFPKQDAREAAESFEGLVRNYLRDAIRRTYADWGFQEELLRGEETISFLLPEIHATRSLGRMLGIRARVAVLDGRYADAVESFAIAFEMGRDISTTKFLVGDLVAIATVGSMEYAVEEFIASEGSPNLYWALLALPDPLVYGQDSIELELDLGLRMFPWLRDVEEADYAPDEWRRLFTETLAEVESDFGKDPMFGMTRVGGQDVPEEVRTTFQQGLATLYALKTYPAAKEALVAAGFAAEEVERMPVAKVLSLQTARAYRYIAHEMEKTWHVKYDAANEMERDVMALMRGPLGEAATPQALEPIPLADTLLPATVAYRRAHERLRRQLAAFAVLEAIRMHAAQAGKLPERLGEIEVVPVPDNPATGEPFEYSLEGETAVLLLPKEDGFHVGKRYEIKLRQQ
jgi:hypothetical protein